jgi:hypothetical protein
VSDVSKRNFWRIFCMIPASCRTVGEVAESGSSVRLSRIQLSRYEKQHTHTHTHTHIYHGRHTRYRCPRLLGVDNNGEHDSLTCLAFSVGCRNQKTLYSIEDVVVQESLLQVGNPTKIHRMTGRGGNKLVLFLLYLGNDSDL